MSRMRRLNAVAAEYGTPCYVYSRAALEHAYRAYDQALAAHPHLICYAVKANSSLAILNLFARLGAGFDIVSGGELARVLAAGGDPAKVVFSGVGKTAAEMRAALCRHPLFQCRIGKRTVRLNQVAGDLGRTAAISLRVNPNVDARTHPYISTGLKDNKFGIAHEQALRVYREAAQMAHLRIIGIDCHIGSQLTEVAPFAEALDRVLELVKACKPRASNCSTSISAAASASAIGMRRPPDLNDYAEVCWNACADAPSKLIVEPGRALVGNAGWLLTRVEYLKHGETKDFAIVDAAMNDLMRPALYDAWHEILPVRERPGHRSAFLCRRRPGVRNRRFPRP
jgi:diaminopimelate decarboxylase